jgi:glucokinase
VSDRVAIGVDVGGRLTRAGAVTERGDILIRVERPTDPTAGTKGIISAVENVVEQAQQQGIEFFGVGVGAAGFIDSATGSVTFSPNMVYDDPQIAAALEARVGLRAIVDNDANAAAWGEYHLGSAHGASQLAFLTLGTGIGSGFIVNDQLLRGARGAGAEFGHTVIDPRGPQCPCGLRGCLEQFASGTAIERMAREAVAGRESSILSFSGSVEAISGEHVARAARQMDEVAREVLRLAGTMLGIGLSNVVNIFEPSAIVLGGSVVAAGEPYLGPARDTLGRMLTAQKRRPVRLDVTSLGGDAGLLGAAMLILKD